MDAFLKEKKALVVEWEERKKTLMPPKEKGGRGYVDLDIVPLCDALNRFEGICTLQSCAGHRSDASDGVLYPGTLWLRLDNVRAERFDLAAHMLAAEATVESVSKIYWRDGKETITLTFKGNERGLLAESSEAILKFFEALSH